MKNDLENRQTSQNLTEIEKQEANFSEDVIQDFTPETVNKFEENTTPKKNNYFNITTSILAILCLVFFASTAFLTVDKLWPAEINRRSASTKEEILNIIQTKYNGTVSTSQEQADGELAGLVSSLNDPYSQFIPKDKIADFQNGLNEKYSGIGIRFNRDGSRVFVTQIFTGGPASQSGILVGDELLKVEDKDVKNLSNDELGTAIRGKENSSVNITISSSGVEKALNLVRKNVQVDLVSLEVRDDVGIINIASFGDTSATKMGEVAAQVKNNPKIKKLVLDLRSNTGGLLDQSLQIASYFLAENSLFVKEAYKSDSKEEKTVKVENSLQDYPIIVATDSSTASASEILAAALRDDRNVKLVGQKSYGKGVVQQIFTLRSGDLLKVTIAEWITPAGNKINGKGLSPDIAVEIDKNSLDKAVEEVNKL